MPLHPCLLLLTIFIRDGAPLPTKDLDAPQNVVLQAVSPHTVLMRWEPPAHAVGLVGYEVLYLINGTWQTNIELPKIQNHTIRNLKSGQVVSAYVRARSERTQSYPNTYYNELSPKVTVTVPHEGGEGEGVKPTTGKPEATPESEATAEPEATPGVTTEGTSMSGCTSTSGATSAFLATAALFTSITLVLPSTFSQVYANHHISY